MYMQFLRDEERRLLERLSALARSNPFLPERIQREREALGDDFEEVSSVWSKQLDRQNPNVAKLAARAEPVAEKLRSRLAAGAKPSQDELRVYEELVFYLLYDLYDLELVDAMVNRTVRFYHDFERRARYYLGTARPRRELDEELPHWFAFMFQVRRASHHIFEFILGSSMPVAELRGAVWQSIFTHDLRRYRRSLFDKMGDLATLISGPSGTGKELVARAIGASRYIPFDPKTRRFAIDPRRTFFPLNLSALPNTLIESELFGHRRGAFTGALADRKGWLELCPELGTVFLDEIGELEPGIQVKLLRALESREFQPLGETRSFRFEGKIVAATNRDLAAEMHSGRFRPDLYYRLCSDLIATPSLDEQLGDRPSDLEELVRFLSRRIVGEREAEDVTQEVMSWIARALPPDYPWPGNVRELEQCVRNVLVRREYRPQLDRPDRPWLVDAAAGRLTAEELLQHYCRLVYARTGSYVETARRLGLDRRTVKARVEALPSGERSVSAPS
jgi:hypothetical protein